MFMEIRIFINTIEEMKPNRNYDKRKTRLKEDWEHCLERIVNSAPNLIYAIKFPIRITFTRSELQAIFLR